MFHKIQPHKVESVGRGSNSRHWTLTVKTKNRKTTERKSVPTRDELLAEIRVLRWQLGRPLTIRDISAARKRGECSPVFRFNKMFGSVHLAIAEAGAGMEPLDAEEIEKRRAGGWRYVKSAEGKLAEKQRMIQRLKELYEKLGSAPKAADIDAASAKGEILPFVDYKRVFGSLPNAFAAAGVPVPLARRVNRETMIEQLKTLEKKLGRMPRSRDINRAAPRGEILGTAELLKEFGSFHNIYQAAGWAVPYRTYTEQEIAESLRQMTRRLGHLPRQKDIYEASSKGDFPSLEAIRKRYGSLGKARRILRLDKIAGKPVRKPAPHPYAWAEVEIIESLQKLTLRLGHLPRYQDVDEASSRGETPSTTTLENRFGSFSKALKKARLAELVTDLPPDWSKQMVKYSKKDVIRSLRDLTEYLGRVPMLGDIDEAARLGTCPSKSRIIKKFGTLEKGRRAARLYEMIRKSETGSDRSSYRAKTKSYTESEIFEMLRRLTKRLGHVPTTAEIDEASKRRECPSIRYLKNKFGSVVKAREWARLDEVAPLKHRVYRRYTKKEIIRYLRDLTERLGRMPRQKDADAASKAELGPSVNTIRHHFGTFKKACKAARLSEIVPNERYAKQGYTKKEIIESLCSLTRQLGRVPGFNDVVAASKEGICPGTTTLATHFGSFTKARKAARLDQVLAN